MYKNELLLKTRELDSESNFNEVVSLIKDHEEYLATDAEVFALYQKNLTLQYFDELGFGAEEFALKSAKEPYPADFMEKFNALPEDCVFTTVEAILREAVASIYLTELSSGDSIARARSLMNMLGNILSLLGNKTEDYDTLKEQLDNYCKIYELYGYELYSHLRIRVWWRSKTDENILRYLAEKFKAVVVAKTENEIYNAYIEEKKPAQVFPFNEKPDIFGEQLIFNSIKTNEAKSFWKEYFAFAKTIREEEYALYKEKSNHHHPLHSFFKMDKDLQESFDYILSQNDDRLTKTATQMRIDTGWDKLKVCDYKAELDKINQSYLILTETIERIKYVIGYYLNKFLKK